MSGRLVAYSVLFVAGSLFLIAGLCYPLEQAQEPYAYLFDYFFYYGCGIQLFAIVMTILDVIFSGLGSITHKKAAKKEKDN